MVFFIIQSIFAPLFESKEQLLYKLESLLIIGYCMGIVVLAVWLFVWLPLALLIPRQFSFWKPGTLAVVGSLVGPAIILVSSAVEAFRAGVPITERLAPNIAGLLFFGVPAVIVGGVTGLVGAILNRRARG
jgi:hypothetical protein